MPVQMRFEHLLIIILLFLVLNNLWHKYLTRKETREEEKQKRPTPPVEAAQSKEVSCLPGRCVLASRPSQAPGHPLAGG